MTIDERLEALVQTVELTALENKRRDERHEALAQTVELMSYENKKRDEQLGTLTQLVGQISEGIARLLLITERHEQRLTDLEGGS